MKVTLNWLNDYVKIDDLAIDFIRDKLLNVGLEVESVTYLGEGIENVVTGKITSLSKHPNADKLSVCLVDIGAGKEVKIVTGAPNAKAGDMVCVALDGATLPDGIKISATDFRGEISHGMLCGGGELKINDAVLEGAEFDGLLILPPDTQSGLCVKKFLGLDDYLFDIAVTANRGDCHSVYGIARELAAALKRQLKPLQLNYSVDAGCGVEMPDIKIDILNKQLCSMYQGAIIEDVRISLSPLWLRRRLWACGNSCKNNLVDITNYVLLEVGQPLHAFDRYRIDGNLSIRNAVDGEKIKALNGLEYAADKKTLLIADDKKPLAIAGVMGGESSAISDSSRSVLLESARFARGSVRQTSRALGLKSDSSARFEKGVDFYSVDTGRRRALALIDQLKVGKIRKDLIGMDVSLPAEKVLTVKYTQFKQILGINIPHGFIKDILSRLSFKVTEIFDTKFDSKIDAKLDAESDAKLTDVKAKAQKAVGIEVVVPLFREDIDNFTDIIEEVVRFYGYDKLKGSRYKSGVSISGGISKRRENINRIENICCGAGAFEINNYSFISAKQLDLLALHESDSRLSAIKILNPISEDFAYMRTQLVSSMLDTIRRNRARQNDDFALFEIDNVFLAESLPLVQLPKERLTLCVGFCFKDNDFYSIKAFTSALLSEFTTDYKFVAADAAAQPFLHPGISAEILIEGNKAGYFGKIHPVTSKNFETGEDVYVLELDLESFLDRGKPAVKFSPLPKFPAVVRDFAIIVDSNRPAGEIVEIAKSSDKLVRSAEIFDVYTGEQVGHGKKSIAFKVTLLNPEKTMTESEINSVCDKLLQNLSAAGASLR